MIVSLYAVSAPNNGLSALSLNGAPLQTAGVFYRAGENVGPCGFNMYDPRVNTFYAEATYAFESGVIYTLEGSCNGIGVFLGRVTASLSQGIFQLVFSSAGFLALSSIDWQLIGPDGSVLAEDSTAVELYFFPANINTAKRLPQGMPVELLRQFVAWLQGPMGWYPSMIRNCLQYTSNGVGGVLPDEAAAVVVLFAFCHNPPAYDRINGKPGFYGKQFRLLQYVEAAPAATCDCEDMQCVVWFLLTFLFGHSVTAYGASGFGILAQNVVGLTYSGTVGLCNNPVTFGTLYPESLVVAPGNSRGFFGVHRFCVDQTAGGVVVDATLGPYAGAIVLADYFGMVVDRSFSHPYLSPNVTTNEMPDFNKTVFDCTPATQTTSAG